MRYTKLGRTNLETSIIGVGLEHLLGQPRETVVAAIGQAIENGVTYFDVIYAIPDYLDAVGAGFWEYAPLPSYRDRLLDATRLLDVKDLQEAYRAMPTPASACTGCGACGPRCPFGVDVMARIGEAAAVFES